MAAKTGAKRTPPRSPGRPLGSKNKMPQVLKAMILEALDKAGGVTYLTRCAKKDPKAFLALLGKTLPLTVKGDPENPLRHVGRIEFVVVDP